MTIRVSVKNEEAPGAAAVLTVEVVTVGDPSGGAGAAEKHALAAQESVTLHVHGGQFLMVDEKDKEGP